MRALILSYTGLIACRFIHREMIINLIYAPLTEFFERIPLGRILNRLSKDVSLLESELWGQIGSALTNTFSLLGDVFIIVYSSSYYSLGPFVIFFYLSIFVMRIYQRFNREAVRLGIICYFTLESISKSPIVSFFAETLNGLPIIRAWKHQNRFLLQHSRNLDENMKNLISINIVNLWFSLRLTFLSFLVNISSLAFCVFLLLLF